MNLHQLFLVNNQCYETGETINVKGLCWHSTGAVNPMIKRYVGPDDGILGYNKYGNHWNQHISPKKCVHGFVGIVQDGSIATYQTLPWNMRGWHAGYGANGSLNDTHIGIEICEGTTDDYEYFNRAYVEAVEVSVYLCKKFGFGAESITTHCEGHDAGLASNHSDVNSYFRHFGKSIENLRRDVAAILKGNIENMYKVVIENFATKEDAQKFLDIAKTISTNGKIVGDTEPVETPETVTLKVGDAVKMVGNNYAGGEKVPTWVKNSKLYIRQLEQNGKVALVSTEPVTKVYTGRVFTADLVKY